MRLALRGKRRNKGQLAVEASLAHELTRSGVAVMGLFWLRWKLRGRERKRLMCLGLSIYRHIHDNLWTNETQGAACSGRAEGHKVR